VWFGEHWLIFLQNWKYFLNPKFSSRVINYNAWESSPFKLYINWFKLQTTQILKIWNETKRLRRVNETKPKESLTKHLHGFFFFIFPYTKPEPIEIPNPNSKLYDGDRKINKIVSSSENVKDSYTLCCYLPLFWTKDLEKCEEINHWL